MSEDQWTPEFFCGPWASLPQIRHSARRLGDMASMIIEGWRVSTNENSPSFDPRALNHPIYRMANIQEFSLQLEPDHWTHAAGKIERWCARPGDVVIKKIPPFRAALVTSRIPPHPFDSSCILVRGLKPREAAWVAVCLMSEEYSTYLLRKSSSAGMPRTGARELRDLPIVSPPSDDWGEFADGIWTTIDELSRIHESFAKLAQEVESEVTNALEETSDSNTKIFQGGSFFDSELLDCESWHPIHVNVSQRQASLRKENYWTSIRSLSTAPDPALQRRMRDLPPSGRFLKLSDGNADLTYSVPEPTAANDVKWSFRNYESPMQAMEVLVSQLVSNPRTVFCHQTPEEDIYLADHWLRLYFRETPGAWALILNSQGIAKELRDIAMGSAMQFTTVERLRSFCLPNLTYELREKWHQSLIEHHQRKSKAAVNWSMQQSKARNLFQQIFQLKASDPSNLPEPTRRMDSAVSTNSKTAE